MKRPPLRFVMQAPLEYVKQRTLPNLLRTLEWACHADTEECRRYAPAVYEQRKVDIMTEIIRRECEGQ